MELIALAIVGVLLYLVLPVAVLVLKDRIADRRSRADYEKTRRERPETIAGTPEYSTRFDHPQFEALEKRVAGRLPDSFRVLHGCRDLLREAGFAFVPPNPRGPRDRWHVVQFLPADVQMLEEYQSFLGTEFLPFADNDGDVYYLDLAEATAADAPVEIWTHDSDERERIADSLTEFLSWRRVKWSDMELDNQG
jgi:hypothetical protein